MDEKSPKSDDFSAFHLNDIWWLQLFFSKLRIPFVAGAFLIYFLTVIPNITFALLIGIDPDNEKQVSASAQQLWYVLGQNNLRLHSHLLQLASAQQLWHVLGDNLFITIPLILINYSHRSLIKFRNEMNEHLTEKELFVSPCFYGSKTSSDIHHNDSEYTKFYLKPMSFRTLQNILDLSFNKQYTLGFGILTGVLAVSIAYATHNVSAFTIPVLGPAPIAWTSYVFCKFFVIWTVLGIFTWTTFSCLFISSYAGRYVYDFIPQKPLAHYYKTTYELASVFWKNGTYVIVSQIPALYSNVYFFGNIEGTTLINDTKLFIGIWLAVLIPLVVILVLVSNHKIKEGMSQSKQRKTKLLEPKLKELKVRFDTVNDDKTRLEYSLLLNEYRDLVSNPDSVGDIKNAILIFSTIIGPPLAAIPLLM